jgi:hypothetical protein
VRRLHHFCRTKLRARGGTKYIDYFSYCDGPTAPGLQYLYNRLKLAEPATMALIPARWIRCYLGTRKEPCISRATKRINPLSSFKRTTLGILIGRGMFFTNGITHFHFTKTR